MSCKKSAASVAAAALRKECRKTQLPSIVSQTYLNTWLNTVQLPFVGSTGDGRRVVFDKSACWTIDNVRYRLAAAIRSRNRSGVFEFLFVKDRSLDIAERNSAHAGGSLSSDDEESSHSADERSADSVTKEQRRFPYSTRNRLFFRGRNGKFDMAVLNVNGVLCVATRTSVASDALLHDKALDGAAGEESN